MSAPLSASNPDILALVLRTLEAQRLQRQSQGLATTAPSLAADVARPPLLPGLSRLPPPPPPPALAPAASASPTAPSVPATEATAPSPTGTLDEEAPRCHLHKKHNKACKFCKTHAQWQEKKAQDVELKRKSEERRQSEKMREVVLTGSLAADDKVALPCLSQFPQVLKERIAANRFYSQVQASQNFAEVKETLFESTSCDVEVNGSPTPFFCCLFRLFTMKLTEGQLRSMLNNRSLWVRITAFLYVRFGVSQDRYWELLSDSLLEHEEFVPWPEREPRERMSEGQFVEQLLTKEKYCEVQLPRIAAGQRRLLTERLVLFETFRRRYAANLEVLSRFEKEGGFEVEVCTLEGEWSRGFTDGPPATSRRKVTVPVKFHEGGRQDVSLGMLICPQNLGRDLQDLTVSRGKSHQELLEKYREQQRVAAVASGKDYCKTSGRHTVHAGGVTFVAGEKRRRDEDEEDREDEEARANQAKKTTASYEQQAKMAAIMQKYLTNNQASKPPGGGIADSVDGPERLRFG